MIAEILRSPTGKIRGALYRHECLLCGAVRFSWFNHDGAHGADECTTPEPPHTIRGYTAQTVSATGTSNVSPRCVTCNLSSVESCKCKVIRLEPQYGEQAELMRAYFLEGPSRLYGTRKLTKGVSS